MGLATLRASSDTSAVSYTAATCRDFHAPVATSPVVSIFW